ncbi:FAD-dependent oxidoreductase [Bryobacter aggregatus]|uniref:FAD-dependent oxidoreductase n=1 Tax=Bryobacter aggregatus TaxID=360054 RepID=UPI0004E2636C|nr:FAD-dependent oxidoreductase [Bryobacter aggregatus]
MQRRSFLNLVAATSFAATTRSKELSAEIAILGGGTGGCAAALGALREGRRVLMTEECRWVGGQLTSQLVPPDEHPWIEMFGGTRSYRSYRDHVRAYYRANFPLTEEARHRVPFNPGGGSVSGITHEPKVSLAVLEGFLAPYVASGQLVLLTEFKPVAASVAGDRVRAVTVEHTTEKHRITISAPYFIDATEQGDLLPLTKCEFVTGFESRAVTGEPSAPDQAQPDNIQSFTVCFAMDYRDGENHVIEKPQEYAFWRDYVPAMKPAWPGKLLSLRMSNPQTLQLRNVSFDPTQDAGQAGGPLNLWLYRRIRRRRNYVDWQQDADISLVNWPQNDYWLGNLHNVSQETAAKHLHRGKQLSLSLLYWLQTEAPRPDGKAGWPGLRLRHDQAGTEDGLAMYPYIRESRRIAAEFTVLEQHVASKIRGEKGTAERFADSVGVGSYRIDLHPSSGGDNYVDVGSLPFQIPMGALIPKRMENLLAGAKNLGVTHITNGCYRLHPVEWNIGESAGALAAEALRTGEPPRQIRNDMKLRDAFQTRLRLRGVQTEWPALSAR